MTGIGFTHIALAVTRLDRTIAFYATFAGMRVIHERSVADGPQVAWITDGTRPFVIVLIQSPTVVAPLLPMAHLGVCCESRARLEELCALAHAEGVLIQPPHDSGPPVGYWAFLRDPDGHTLELSYGQEIGLTVAASGPRSH